MRKRMKCETKQQRERRKGRALLRCTSTTILISCAVFFLVVGYRAYLAGAVVAVWFCIVEAVLLICFALWLQIKPPPN